jgi:hypothetical protein
MRQGLQLAGCVLALAISAGLVPKCAAQHPHYAAQKPSKPANAPPHQPHQGQGQHQGQRQGQRQGQPQQNQQRPQAQQQYQHGGQNGAAGHAQSAPDWNRPGGGTVHADRPPSANTPPKNFNNLSPQDKQRVLNNNRQWQNLSPAQRQQVQERAEIWKKMTPAQQDHIRNDVLPKWKQMPPDRKRSIENRLAVLQNMPESARNQHLNDPNFTRGMTEEDKSTLRDLSHLHVGGPPDPPNE